MYEAFFGLREKPFSLLPDPSFLFLSQKHREALTLLEYGLLNQAGFIVLTGEIGSGKTTLMRYLLNRLDSDVEVGLISHAHQSLGELMEWICLAFDIRVAAGRKLDQHQAFIDFLIDRYAKGKQVLLIVDEAQNLGVEKLEELRLLSNINADKDLVLQIMLLGQPQLRKLLSHSDLEQFVQRIAASYHLGRLSAPESHDYIQHRIFVAGGQYEIFTNDACYAVHHYSKGVPRLINLICDTAMVYAYGGGERCVSGKAVDDLIALHAPHLLIQIERDEAGQPLPRERLHEDESVGAGDRKTTVGPGTLANGLQEDSVGDRKVESPVADRSSGLVIESSPVGAPDPSWSAWTRTQDESMHSLGGNPHPAAAPLSAFVSPGLEADTPVDVLPQGRSGALAEAGSKLRPATAGLPGNTRIVDQAAKRPPRPGRVRAIWLVLAMAMFVGIGLSAFRFGWLSLNDQVNSAVTDRPPENGSGDRISVVRVDPAAPKAAAPGPEIDSPPQQAPQRAFVADRGPGSAAVTPDTHASVEQSQTADRQVQAGPASVPARSAESLSSKANDFGPMESDSVRVAPVSAGSGPGIAVVSSDMSAAMAGPIPQIAPPLQAPEADNPDSASRPPVADRDLSLASTDEGASDQLVRQPETPNPAVEKEAGGSVGKLGESVRSPSSTAETDSSARIANKALVQPEVDSAPVAVTGAAAEQLPRGIDAGIGPADGAASPDTPASGQAPQAVDSRTDGATGSGIAVRETPRTEVADSGLDQLASQLKGLALDVERQDDRLVVNLGRSVRFSDGSAVLDASARDALKRIAELVKDPIDVRVRVIGHTDSSGSESLNQRLSDLRARVVVRYLAANGVSAARLDHQGRGKSEPKVAAEQEQVQGPEINRRIELEVSESGRAPD